MAIATYTDLQTAIANYLARPGDTLVSTPAPDFVTLAESRIAYGADAPFPSRPLRIRAMETTVNLITGPTQQDTGATSGGSANAQTVTLATLPILALGLTIGFTAGFSNTGTTTLNPNGLGSIPFQKGIPAADLVAGDLIGGAAYLALQAAGASNLGLRVGYGLAAALLIPVRAGVAVFFYETLQAARGAEQV